MKIRRTRLAGHCWKSKDELIRDVLWWTPSHGRAKAGRPAKTYIQQLCADTGCSLEDLPEVMDNRKVWWERIKNICVDRLTWWWWWFKHCIYVSIRKEKHHHRQCVSRVRILLTFSLLLSLSPIPPLSLYSYHPSLLIGPLDVIQCPHSAGECTY